DPRRHVWKCPGRGPSSSTREGVARQRNVDRLGGWRRGHRSRRNPEPEGVLMSPRILLRSIVIVLVLGDPPGSMAQRPRLEFTRMVAHWDAYSDPGYLPFIDEAKPEVVQVGFYGGHFWSLAHTSFGDGYPAHFPVRGLAEC